MKESVFLEKTSSTISFCTENWTNCFQNLLKSSSIEGTFFAKDGKCSFKSSPNDILVSFSAGSFSAKSSSAQLYSGPPLKCLQYICRLKESNILKEEQQLLIPHDIRKLSLWAWISPMCWINLVTVTTLREHFGHWYGCGVNKGDLFCG